MHITSTHRPGSDATVEERSISKKFLRSRKIYLGDAHQQEGESVSTYPRRPNAEAFDNVVDVVELLLIPTDQAPNVRHL